LVAKKKCLGACAKAHRALRFKSAAAHLPHGFALRSVHAALRALRFNPLRAPRLDFIDHLLTVSGFIFNAIHSKYFNKAQSAVIAAKPLIFQIKGC
jgi:hypothetical protein